MKLERPALILIDIQKGFEDEDYWGGHRNNPEAEQRAGELLRIWRKHNLPVFHVQHCSTHPHSPLVEGKPGHELQEVVTPGKEETLIKKKANSAFIGTDLEQRLRHAGIRQLVIAGLTTDHCVSTTVRMAGNLGFDTYLVEDATATFDKTGPNGKKYSAEIIHDTTLASLHGEFCTVVDARAVCKQLT